MSLSATLFGRDSFIFKATNILGLGGPAFLDKQFGAGDPEPTRLGEISQQTAKEAEPRVIVWGRVRPIGGNLIHCQAPIKRMVKEKTQGGKGGGGKKTQKVEHVFRTYAIGVCEAPITAFARIWRNNKLVYDARGTDWGVTNNPVFLKTFKLYLGGWGQMPSPDLEAIWGVGNVPAYRGTAYMVAIDEDLTELGGSVPQWLFEVERAEGTYLTSRPYSVEAIEEVNSTDAKLTAVSMPLARTAMDPESLNSDQSLTAINFRSTFAKYSYQESIDSDQTLESISFRKVLMKQNMGDESIDSDQTLTAINHKVGLIKYTNYAPESLDSDHTLEAIHHANP